MRTFLFFFMVTLSVMPAWAEQASRQAFDQSLVELRDSPGNTELREKVIQMAQSFDPPPAIPEEAKRAMGRGKAAFKNARSPEEFETSRQELEQAVHLAPWWPEAYYNLALVEENQLKYRDALAHLKLYLKTAPQAPDKAAIEEKIYELEYQAEQVGKAKEYRDRGATYQNSNQFAEAEREFREAVRLAPNWGEAHAMLGASLNAQRKYSEAIKALDEALRLGYKDLFVYWRLGEAYEYGEENIDKAIEVQETGLQQYPFHVNAVNLYYNLGTLYARKNDLENAIRNNEKAVELGHPKSAEIRGYIEEDKRKLGQ